MDRSILVRFQCTGGEMLLNMGPQHPSPHGVINFVVQADGEVMIKAVPEVVYLHRGMEKLVEATTWAGYMPFTLSWPSGSIYPPGGRFWLDPTAHYYGMRADKFEKYYFGLCSAHAVSASRLRAGASA